MRHVIGQVAMLQRGLVPAIDDVERIAERLRGLFRQPG